MIDGFSWTMLAAAAGVGVAHTLLGPDHYVPFVALARARNWSRRRTVVATLLCGGGHVLSSLVLGVAGVLAGIAIGRIESIEEARGGVAAWVLVAGGFAYMLWGVRRALRRVRGIEPHAHGHLLHIHSHGGHVHEHAQAQQAGHRTTFWFLFLVFVLGPCEPLIPLFLLPASRGRWDLAIGVGTLFTLVTLITMVAVTLALLAGAKRLNFGRVERWNHAMAGFLVAASGLTVITLGL